MKCKDCGKEMKLFDELKTEIDGVMYQFWVCDCGFVHDEEVKTKEVKLIKPYIK